MNIVQNLMERLRSLVGSKGWNYCLLWKLSDDQRFLEWVDCCCAGIDQTSIENGGELQFPVTPVLPCRDVMYQHPRTRSCDLLSQLPSSIPLDSGSYAETLISNQPRWLNFTNGPESNILEEIGTRVLIPVAGGLIELFITKQVPEDQNVLDFVITQYNISLEQEATMNPGSMGTSFTMFNIQEVQPKPQNDQKDHNNIHFQSTLSPALENLNLPYDISADRIHLCSSPMDFSSYNPENKTKNDMFFENHQFVSPSAVDNGLQEMDPMLQSSMMSSEAGVLLQGNSDKDTVKPENGRSDSVSDCSDQIDDEDDGRYRRRTGSKGPQSKNLMAERKRRKKLNERLYTLRSLVPKISKLDRASILGDAIEFMKDLQKQAKELQDELEEHSDLDDDRGAKNTCSVLNGVRSVKHPWGNIQSESLMQNAVPMDPKSENENGSKQNLDSEHVDDKTQQMEVQVEVAQMDGNKFFVQVFCEHKPGGFVRLMEVLDSLGLEVTNANVTSNLGLVSNVFKVEKKDSDTVQADHVRDSLLELTRNPSRGWSGLSKAAEGNSGTSDCHHHHQQHLHIHHISSHHNLLNHFHN
ncbi:hypothetical protein SLE2022_199590 [Rubroshorea leprosula]